MAKTGPIIIVEDDQDDKEVFEDITRELGIENELVWFTDADDAYAFLLETKTQPFLIFSDINLPGTNGLDFKHKIDSHPELRRKSIPFVFMSTAFSQQEVNEAYITMTVQGFFVKPNKYSDMKLLLRSIYFYWGNCKHTDG